MSQAERLILCVTTGRSGTALLADLFASLDGVVSLHEPEPKFSHVMRAAQEHPEVARRFWQLAKLSVVAATRVPIYVETSHLACKGFIEPLLEMGIVPDLVLLQREMRDVALSLYELNTIPGRSPEGLKFCLSPGDAHVLALPGWEKLHDYQLCYWYCLETARRAKLYAEAVQARGGAVATLAFTDLIAGRNLARLFDELRIGVTPEELERAVVATQKVVNAKKEHKQRSGAEIQAQLQTFESEVTARVAAGRLSEPPPAVPGQGRPLLSSLVLSWNRADLLRRTLASLTRTMAVAHEIIIVDNASTDGAAEVVRDFVAHTPTAKAIYLRENLGGEAFNLALACARGDLIHLSENDLEYLPGWSERVVEAFTHFPDLGQLSLFGPVPTDDEAWSLKPCSLVHARGRVLYRAEGNVGTPSVLPRRLFDAGVRIQNSPAVVGLKMPDDHALSAAVQQAELLVAWNDHYLVRNLGHSITEFNGRPDYYQANYRAKSWLGEAGWRERIKAWEGRSRPFRRSFLFPSEPLCAEKTAPTAECPEPQLWSMFDGWSAEVETLEFLYALVRLLKPKQLLETGTWHGFAAAAMGRALRDNGRGHLTTLEIFPESVEVSRRRISELGLGHVVTVVQGASLEYSPAMELDFILLDSELNLREAEFRRFMPALARGATVLFHDTSQSHTVVQDGIQNLIKSGIALEGFFMPTPRGLFLARYAGMQRPDNNDAIR